MIRRGAATVALAAIIGLPTAAVADIEVKPDVRAPKVAIFGEIVRRVEPIVPALPSNRPAMVQETAPLAVPRACKVDPEAGTYGCRVDRPAEEEEAAEDGEERELTEGDVLTAVREIGMPSLAIRIEPGATTLVNVKTNFYTDPAPFNRSVELLGFDVDIEATPASFSWTHGDGTSSTTRSPGRPYPHLDVTHRYRAPAAAVRPRVDVTYEVRYRVDGGPWAPLSQTLTATGPAGTLAVNEAAPVLTAP